jgi:large subunit ribosomal protein L15
LNIFDFRIMKLNQLSPASGATHTGRRVGRGEGSTKGGTSGRGHKGAKSRSGYSKKIGFEGGQMPIQRRLPKFGFTNFNRVSYKPLNLDVLQRLADNHGLVEINLDTLRTHGLVSKNDLVKILGSGELKAKLSVSVHAFSSSARTAIEQAGGAATTL